MKAKNYISKISYQPKIIIWLIYLVASVFTTVLPIIGPFFMGYIIYKISTMGLMKNIGDIFWPSLAGVFLHGLIFQLPSWPLETSCLFLLLNSMAFVIGGYWKKLLF
jgi:hypothetical protein